jgi:hypothetical protein
MSASSSALVIWSICALLTQLKHRNVRQRKFTKLEQFLKIDYIFSLKKYENIAARFGHLRKLWIVNAEQGKRLI